MIGHTYCKYSYKEQMKAVEIVNDMLKTFICEDENDSNYRLATISIDKDYRFTHSVEWIEDDEEKESFKDFMRGY
jgi:hypothetical protein